MRTRPVVAGIGGMLLCIHPQEDGMIQKRKGTLFNGSCLPDNMGFVSFIPPNDAVAWRKSLVGMPLYTGEDAKDWDAEFVTSGIRESSIHGEAVDSAPCPSATECQTCGIDGDVSDLIEGTGFLDADKGSAISTGSNRVLKVTCGTMVRCGGKETSVDKNTHYDCQNENHQGVTENRNTETKLCKLVGWVKKLIANRDKTAVYMEVVDGTSPMHVPVIVRKPHKDYAEVDKIDVGDAITVVGAIETKYSASKVPQLRIVVENDGLGHSLTLHQKERHCDTNPVTINGVYPITYLREHCNLRVRNPRVQATFRIRSKVTEKLFQIFTDMGFIHVTTPTLTGMNCEGMGEIFKVAPRNKAFHDDQAVPPNEEDNPQMQGNDTYLSVSGQLELEAMCSGISRVWKLGPAFRADRSDTPRHLSEFWMIEAEMNDFTLKELIATIHTIITKSAETILAECGDELDVLSQQSNENITEKLNLVKNMGLKTITYQRAMDLLNRAKESDPNMEHTIMGWGDPLTAAHERSLIKIVQQPLIAVTNYPAGIMPFYMEKCQDGTVNNVDIIAEGVGEIAGGSLREVRYDILKRAMEEHKIVGSEYDQYLELRKFGNSPHGGFGIGLERMLMFLLRIQNIRDVIHFPKLRKKYSVD